MDVFFLSFLFLPPFRPMWSFFIFHFSAFGINGGVVLSECLCSFFSTFKLFVCVLGVNFFLFLLINTETERFTAKRHCFFPFIVCLFFSLPLFPSIYSPRPLFFFLHPSAETSLFFCLTRTILLRDRSVAH